MRRALIRFVFLVVVPGVAAFVGAQYYVESTRYVNTDNAYVKTTVVAVSAEVSGRIEQVLVRQNVRVNAGELLFVVDPEPFRIAVHKAEAELNRVKNEIKALRADYRQAGIERAVAEDDIAYYERVFRRQRALVERGHASRARFEEAERNLSTSRQRAGALRQKSLRILARLGGGARTPIEAHPDFLQAKAARDEAELDLRRTRVHAPANGVVGPVRIEFGEYLIAGQPVLPLIVTAKPWIEANLKETQLTHVKIGQAVEVVVDAYPGRRLKARVQSISPSTGAELSILPPQNATGNWVKVVQRIPVRIALEPVRPALALRTGMTVSVSIDTGRETSLIDLIGSAFAWKADRE